MFRYTFTVLLPAPVSSLRCLSAPIPTADLLCFSLVLVFRDYGLVSDTVTGGVFNALFVRDRISMTVSTKFILIRSNNVCGIMYRDRSLDLP